LTERLTNWTGQCLFVPKPQKRKKRKDEKKTNFHFSNEKQNRPAAGRLSGLWKNNRLMSVIHISRVVHLDSSDWPMAVAAAASASPAAEKQPALHYYAQLRFLAQFNHWLISVFVQRVCMCVYISSNSFQIIKKSPSPPGRKKKKVITIKNHQKRKSSGNK
jgi:hypothetical protein